VNIASLERAGPENGAPVVQIPLFDRVVLIVFTMCANRG